MTSCQVSHLVHLPWQGPRSGRKSQNSGLTSSAAAAESSSDELLVAPSRSRPFIIFCHSESWEASKSLKMRNDFISWRLARKYSGSARRGALYRVTHLLANLGWVDFDLGCSPGWLAATVATYCPSGELPKSKSTQPRFASRCVTLYVSQQCET